MSDLITILSRLRRKYPRDLDVDAAYKVATTVATTQPDVVTTADHVATTNNVTVATTQPSVVTTCQVCSDRRAKKAAAQRRFRAAQVKL